MCQPKIYVVMGVSGCGKSTIGALLAKNLAIPFFDADDYHPKSNVAKMASGIPLTDDDRQGWLESLNELAKSQLTVGAVIACSALKQSYREIISCDINNDVVIVYLKGTFSEIETRLQQRENHFMPSALLQSQFNTLEEPAHAINVSIMDTPEHIIKTIINAL